MGGIVSTGQNNDDLVNNLLEVDYIKSAVIERVFRAVDRAEYFLPEGRINAYKDIAWKYGNLHLSAPCIYSEVMEGLCLGSGMSFLNLGSGTGYLSTMIGLILGKNGINHGVEIHEDVVQYANKRLEEFKKYSGAIDEFDFCEPTFVQGNCLCLTNDSHLYDRIYCGAACPSEYEDYMKHLLKVGGMLVMPMNEHLLQIKRTSEAVWDMKVLLPVSFASLVPPIEGNPKFVTPIEIQPLSLQALVRTTIRSILRKNIKLALPPIVKKEITKKAPKKKRILRRLIVPLFDTDSSDNENGDNLVVLAGRHGFRGRTIGYDNFFTHLIGTFHPTAERQSRATNTEAQPVEQEENDAQVSNADVQAQDAQNPEEPTNSGDLGMEVDNNEPSAVVVQENMEVNNLKLASNPQVDYAPSNSSCVAVDGSQCGEERQLSLSSDIENLEDTRSDTKSPRSSRKTTNREKFDSGLGDENEIMSITSEGSDCDDDDIKSVASSSSDEELETRRNKRGSQPKSDNKSGFKWRRIDVRRSISCDSSSDNDNNDNLSDDNTEMRMYQSQYTAPMKIKIQKLPLPQILKNYLNFYRDF